MAATTTVVKRGAAGDLFFRVVDVLLDGSYPAGGYPIAPKDLGFGTNGQIVLVNGDYSKTGGWGPASWDYTNNKLQVFDASGVASAVNHEVAPATVLTGVSVRLLVWGYGQG
jgi:hypothetical protein